MLYLDLSCWLRCCFVIETFFNLISDFLALWCNFFFYFTHYRILRGNIHLNVAHSSCKSSSLWSHLLYNNNFFNKNYFKISFTTWLFKLTKEIETLCLSLLYTLILRQQTWLNNACSFSRRWIHWKWWHAWNKAWWYVCT